MYVGLDVEDGARECAALCSVFSSYLDLAKLGGGGSPKIHHLPVFTLFIVLVLQYFNKSQYKCVIWLIFKIVTFTHNIFYYTPPPPKKKTNNSQAQSFSIGCHAVHTVPCLSVHGPAAPCDDGACMYTLTPVSSDAAAQCTVHSPPGRLKKRSSQMCTDGRQHLK